MDLGVRGFLILGMRNEEYKILFWDKSVKTRVLMFMGSVTFCWNQGSAGLTDVSCSYSRWRTLWFSRPMKPCFDNHFNMFLHLDIWAKRSEFEIDMQWYRMQNWMLSRFDAQFRYSNAHQFTPKILFSNRFEISTVKFALNTPYSNLQ